MKITYRPTLRSTQVTLEVLVCKRMDRINTAIQVEVENNTILSNSAKNIDQLIEFGKTKEWLNKFKMLLKKLQMLKS